MTPIVRILYFQCKTVACGCGFSAQLEVTHIISPSAYENPRVRLPYRPLTRRRPGTMPLPANDDHATGGAAVAH